MIDVNHPAFATHSSMTGAGDEFTQHLSVAIERHMKTSQKQFRPSSLRDDFLRECSVRVSLQAINSALVTLIKRKLIVQDGRGAYRHARFA
jgi:hypothetical protein